MRVEESEKLDFDDVLIRPKRSTLTTRSEVSVTKQIKRFKNSGHSWSGTPIIAANMDTTGTIEMAEKLAEHGWMTALTKHYPVDELGRAYKEIASNRLFYSIGMNSADFEKLKYFVENFEVPEFVCIDVANGYTEAFVEYVKKVRDFLPKTTIMAGNVVTAEMTQELLIAGADIIKIGIGPGCFPPGHKVITSNGLKNIEDIDVGEKVLTHTGEYRRVSNTFVFDDKDRIITVNSIKATPTHEFYVVHKKYADVVTEDNIDKYAEWVTAENLTKDYLLVDRS